MWNNLTVKITTMFEDEWWQWKKNTTKYIFCNTFNHFSVDTVAVGFKERSQQLCCNNFYQNTHTVRDCFHLGLCVLLHFSVLFNWPSTVTSTYGLGPNQFFLFSFSLAERTTTMKTKPMKSQSCKKRTHCQNQSVV